MSQRQKMFHCKPGSRLVICTHTGQIIKAKVRRRICYQNAWNLHLIKALPYIFRICSEKQYSQRMTLNGDFYSLFQFIILFIQVIHHTGIIFPADQALHLLDNGSKKHILRTFNDDRDTVAALFFQMLCITI